MAAPLQAMIRQAGQVCLTLWRSGGLESGRWNAGPPNPNRTSQPGSLAVWQSGSLAGRALFWLAEPLPNQL